MINIRLISIIYRPEISNSRLCDWSENIEISPINNIGLAGTYAIGNGGQHEINGSCSPIIYPLVVPGDVTMTFEATSPFVPEITMPEYIKDDNATVEGIIRLFSPFRRSSRHKYCSIKPANSFDGGAAHLLSTHFTLPVNRILHECRYYGDSEISTDPDCNYNAVAAATVATCAKLKESGGDIRIYVIKYRKQEKYRSFPFHDSVQENKFHDYSAVNACASSGNYLYDVDSPTKLKEALNKIAADIKWFAGFEDAKETTE
jgi:hypothetical protein